MGTTSGAPILAAMIAAGGFGGPVACVLPLCLGGIGVHLWLVRRRRATGG